MKKKQDFNPFEMVLEIAEVAKENEWKDKEDVKEEEQTIKKIINRPTEIKNYPYDAYKEFSNTKDDDLS
jgi:protein subunit release factor B